MQPIISWLFEIYLYGLPYTLPSYSDVMSYLLLALVGADFDPSSPFLTVTFILVPALTLLPRLALFTSNAVNISQLNWVSFLWALFYTLTPQLITAHLYYPLFF